MKLAYWMYAGPAHIGTLRIASSFKNVHAIMHAPLGDDYFNVMRSMLERKRDFTPVTASVVDRHVLARGSQEKVINNICRKDKEEKPDLVILTPTCTSSILQEDLQNFVNRARQQTNADVILADVNHYRFNEMQAADRTLQQIIQYYLKKNHPSIQSVQKTLKPSVNIIGSYDLSFHNQHDVLELKRLFSDLEIDINLILPASISVHDIQNLPKAWFNIVPYREIGLLTAQFLESEYDMPYINRTPMGITEIALFIRDIQQILNKRGLNINFENYIDRQTRFISQAAWFSKSIDCQNLTGKKAFVFGDASHAAAMTKILTKEMGIEVMVAGTYCKHDKEWFTEQVSEYSSEIIITDNHKIIADLINRFEPDAIFGTQMERHIAKRLNIPCAVISAPVHVQNFPLSYRPFCGYEGANQIADLVYNSFTLGMEDHLLEIFGGHDTKNFNEEITSNNVISWSTEAQSELNKIPGFVRQKVKKKTEDYALSQGQVMITRDIMYAAKENQNNYKIN